MLLHIYDIVSKMMAVLFLLLVAHYVFLEPMLKKGRLLFWLLCLTGTVVTEFGNLGDFEAFFPFVMVGIYIAISLRN